MSGADARALRFEFEELLYREAAWLDEGHFEKWLDLFDSTVRYWAPVRENVPRGEEPLEDAHRLTHFEDDKDTLELRVKRLRTGFAHAEEPPSRTRHFVSNVRVLDATDPARVSIASNLLVFRSRERRDEVLFSCGRRDWWRRTQAGWRCQERRILFDHDVIESLTVLF